MGDSLALPQPYDDLPHRRTFLVQLAALLGLLIISMAGGWYAHVSVNQAFATAREARELDLTFGQLLFDLINAETGQRGYLLTGKPDYLDPYHRAIDDLPTVRERLRALAEGHPDRAEAVTRLDPLISAKLAELADTIQLKQNGRAEDALAVVAGVQGRATMKEVRRIVADMRAVEADEIAHRREEILGWLQAVRYLVVGCFAAYLGVVGTMVRLWRRADRTRQSYADHLIAANAGLRAALTDRDRLVSVVSHDLRGLFTPILGYADLLREEAAQSGQSRLSEYARHVVAGTIRANDLLSNLVEWAKKSVGSVPLRPAMVPVRGAVDQVIQLYADVAAEKKIELVNAVGSDVCAYVDPPILQAVLRNLVSNAVKYSNTGGRVEVGGKGNGRTTLTVRDSGVGMADDVKARLLGHGRVVPTPGTRGEKGTGLGLVICADYVVRSGGGIEVDTIPGDGTTFTVTLPNKAG